MWHGSSTLEFSVNGVRRLQLTGNRVRHYGSGEAYFESRPVASNGGGFIWYDGSNPRWLMATTGGTNLRLYSYTAVADIIRFEANGDINLGTNILFVDRSANQVGINDTTPAYSLDVNGSFRVTGASLMGTLTMTGDLNVATSLLFVDQSATRVGINDNNPSYTLDVNGSFRVSGAVKGGTTHAGTVSSYAPSSWPTPTVSLNMTAAGSTNINFFGVDSGDCHTIIVHNTSGASRTLTFTNYDGLGTGLSSSQSVANGETWVLVASGFPGPGGSGTEVIVTLAAQY